VEGVTPYSLPERVAVCNETFDKVLNETFEKYLDDLEPYRGKEWKSSFNQRFLFKNWTGHIRLFNVELDGLSSAERISAANIYQDVNGIKTLETELLFPRLFHTAQYSIAFAGLGMDRHIFGHADDIHVSLNIVFDSRTESLQLKRFKILAMKDVRLRVDGPWAPISGIYNTILQMISSYAKRTQKFAIEKVFAHRIVRVINDSPESDILKSILTML
jgi:hypothetical protein